MVYNKNENENEGQYIFRICSMKDENGWTWQQIADILNDSLGYKYGESCYRKKFQSFNSMFNDNSESIFTEDEYLNKIKDAKMALESERQKLYATKTEMQRIIRQNSRFELFYENIKNEIKCLSEPNYNPLCVNSSGECDYVLTIADIHDGAKFDIDGNSYSMQECENRFKKLLCEVVLYIKNNNIRNLKVVELGDTITGLLRISDLQLNETSVVNATIHAARLIAWFLNELSTYCYVDYYHTPSANHTQMRPLGTKASELANEDVEYVIGNYISDLLAMNNRVTVNLNFGHDYIKIPIFDFNVLAMHGHTIKNLETALKDLSVAHGELIDYLMIGHWHNGKQIPGNAFEHHDTEVLMCPSFQGTDPYALNKLGKSSKAACKLYKFNSKFGCTGTEKIILN